LNRARTGIGTVFHEDGTMALDQPQQGEDDQHRHQQTTIKKHRNGGAPSALEDGAVARTISIDTVKQQSAS
jgi:hypothetical protein